MGKLLVIASPNETSPAVGFDQPLEMIKACHRRIEQQCATLIRLASHLKTSRCDTAAAQAAAAVLRYFNTAAPLHHADEEENLFPALLESMAGSDAVCLRTLVESLEAEHSVLETHWRALRPALVNISAGSPAVLHSKLVEQFEQDYARHIQREEQELLPMAERLLDSQALNIIGSAMRQRRNTTA